MKKALFNQLCWLFLAWITFLPACTQQEDVVRPQENCDTVATVQLVPSCGLQLLLENNQKLIPLNTTSSTNQANKIIYKINNFPVQVGQRIIIGYRSAPVKPMVTPCNVSDYRKDNLVDITCIVSIEQGA